MSDVNLKSAVITVTGGTGSFGSTMVSDLLAEPVSEIRIFSRDENKQDEMRNRLKDERLKFFIGDVRDRESVNKVVKGSDYVFHAAALKQVPSCEFFPSQAIATNVKGSSNVIDASVNLGVKGIVCLSTDKAVYPICVMGMTKSLMEKTAMAYARDDQNMATRIAITRYGNVMMSRGSVIPLFAKQILAGEPVSITNPDMTRFLMSLSDSVKLVKFAFTSGTTGDLYVRKGPACTVRTLAMAVAKVLNLEEKYDEKIIGTRHGEKLYESLLGAEERAISSDLGEYFKIPLDTRSLDYQIYFEKGKELKGLEEAYTSHNTQQLSVSETATLLNSLPEFQNIINGGLN
jgi:UDP-glucose 4-epimerase